MNEPQSTNEQDGGPAFPFVQVSESTGEPINGCFNEGMSLRDWFAGQEKIDSSEEFGWELCEALAGRRPIGNWDTNPIDWLKWSCKWQAKVRYARADAMLESRNNQ